MKNPLVAFVLTLVLSLGFYTLNVSAEEAPDPVAEEAVDPLVEFEGAEFSYGTAKSASADQLVVSEYDYENDKDIDVTYSLTAETTYDGVNSATEIAAGDSVDIDYELKGEQKVALAVAVEKGGEESEDLALELEEAAPAAETPAA